MVLLSFFFCLLVVGGVASPQGPGRPGHGQPGHDQPGGHGRPGHGGGPGGSGAGAASISPAYDWIFEYPLPIPPVAQPKYSEKVKGANIRYYELTIESFEKQVYPNLGPAHFTGYNGTSPGPTFHTMRGEETVVRVLNQGSGPAAMHLHGSPTHSPWDGWASDLLQPGQFKDYYYPNTQAGPLWYHDHVDHSTGPDVYYGQAGSYIIYDPAEDSLGLPLGDYDVPLALSDKIYQSNGDLASPEASDLNFLGDILEVNNQPWPYFEVEPRKYRLRFFCMSLSRAFELQFVDDETSQLIDVQVIASDAGLFEHPVTTNDIAISMGERYEVVIDFALFQGKNITLMNSFDHQIGVPQFPNTDKIMRFTVSNTVTSTANNGDVPGTLSADIPWPPDRTTVDHVFNFQHGGDDLWTINGVDFDDINNRILARPQQGTVELWEMNYASGPGIHPAHIHLVNFRILSRTGGQRPVLPYESAGLKDTVFLAPGESVQVLAIYGPWNGMYLFHCHNLIHEDNLMMDVFNVTLLEELGYKYQDTQEFQNPLDPRFQAQASSAAAYGPAAIQSTLSYLGHLDAYKPGAKVATAEASYYATAGFPSVESGPVVSATVAALTAAETGSAVLTEGPAFTGSIGMNIGGHPEWHGWGRGSETGPQPSKRAWRA